MSNNRGFTLVELIVVIMLMGILASSFMIFFKPAVDAFIDARRRADMTDAADTALRKMAQDIRRAVPNSLNVIDGTTTDGNTACFQVIPTIGGGRYRTDIDILDTSLPALNADAAAPFRVQILAMQTNVPIRDGDTIVINNQNADDVYDGASRASINAVTGTTPPALELGLATNPTTTGYVGGRFQIVASTETGTETRAERALMYTCANNTLTRKTLTNFSKKSACEIDGVLVAGNVSECTFSYNNAGATHGLLTMQLVLRHAASGESISLGYAIHVDNTP